VVAAEQRQRLAQAGGHVTIVSAPTARRRCETMICSPLFAVAGGSWSHNPSTNRVTGTASSQCASSSGASSARCFGAPSSTRQT
jgi:hypothetical protein